MKLSECVELSLDWIIAQSLLNNFICQTILADMKPGKRTKQWLSFRRKFLEGRRNHEGYYTCERCGLWVQYVHVDHIQKRSVRPDLMFEPSNLQVLCPPCHFAVTEDKP